MAARAGTFQRARAAARRLLHEAGVTAPEHIDVEAIARAQGAEIVYGDLRGANARVMRIGSKGVARIRVSDRITHPGVQRFSVAHELGHLVLGHELPTVADAVDPAIAVARACERPRHNRIDPEAEADVFGAELLMPEPLTKRRCEVSPVCLKPVRSIARDFRTSLSASAIRFVELTSERCAAVYAEKGAVSWAVHSPTFKATIQRRTPLDRTSVAHDYFRTGTLDERAQPVPAAAWIDHSGDAEIIEHSVALPDLRAVVSLLWVPESVAPRLKMFE